MDGVSPSQHKSFRYFRSVLNVFHCRTVHFFWFLMKKYFFPSDRSEPHDYTTRNDVQELSFSHFHSKWWKRILFILFLIFSTYWMEKRARSGLLYSLVWVYSRTFYSHADMRMLFDDVFIIIIIPVENNRNIWS